MLCRNWAGLEEWPLEMAGQAASHNIHDGLRTRRTQGLNPLVVEHGKVRAFDDLF